MLYKSQNKQHQDEFILKYTKTTTVSRHRPVTGERNNSARGSSSTYYIRRQNGVLVTVCRQTFLRVLRVTQGRVTRLIQHGYKTGSGVREEARGGNRKLECHVRRREAVIQMIKGLK